MNNLEPRLAACAALICAATVWGQVEEGTVYLPPPENTHSEFQQLTDDLTPAQKLQQLLAEGNVELAAAIEEHKRQRTFATKDRIYQLLFQLSDRIVDQIGGLHANEDRIRDNLMHMSRKVGDVKHNLSLRSQELARLLADAQSRAEVLRAELRDLAVRIRAKPDNEEALRGQFRSKLLHMQRVSRQHQALGAHVKLIGKLSSQIDRVESFFGGLGNNVDLLLEGLSQQKDLLVMRVEMLRESAELELWLRGESESDESVIAIVTRIGELQGALQQLNAASDVVIRMNDMTDLIDSLPDFEAFDLPGTLGGVEDARTLEDQYIDYFLKN